MKKVKFILSGLLVAMLFFAVHDYMTMQMDLTQDSQPKKTLVKAEHSVFHTPMILTSHDNDMHVEVQEKISYTLKNFTVKNFHNSLFKPPRLS